MHAQRLSPVTCQSQLQGTVHIGLKPARPDCNLED